MLGCPQFTVCVVQQQVEIRSGSPHSRIPLQPQLLLLLLEVEDKDDGRGSNAQQENDNHKHDERDAMQMKKSCTAEREQGGNHQNCQNTQIDEHGLPPGNAQIFYEI